MFLPVGCDDFRESDFLFDEERAFENDAFLLETLSEEQGTQASDDLSWFYDMLEYGRRRAGSEG